MLPDPCVTLLRRVAPRPAAAVSQGIGSAKGLLRATGLTVFFKGRIGGKIGRSGAGSRRTVPGAAIGIGQHMQDVDVIDRRAARKGQRIGHVRLVGLVIHVRPFQPFGTFGRAAAQPVGIELFGLGAPALAQLLGHQQPHLGRLVARPGLDLFQRNGETGPQAGQLVKRIEFRGLLQQVGQDIRLAIAVNREQHAQTPLASGCPAPERGALPTLVPAGPAIGSKSSPPACPAAALTASASSCGGARWPLLYRRNNRPCHVPARCPHRRTLSARPDCG